MSNIIISDPVDLPPGSRKAWRELVKAVQGSQKTADSAMATSGRAVDQANGVLTAVGVQAEDVAALQEAVGIIDETYVNPEMALQPTQPVLSSNVGVAVATWDGLLIQYEDPADPSGPSSSIDALGYTGFRYVYAEVSVDGDPEGVWMRDGQPLNSAGSIQLTGVVGDELFVRLRSLNYAGSASEPSVSSSITVSGVSLVDLAPDVADAIQEAQTTADGKNAIYAQEDEPTEDPDAPFKQGDQWWVVDPTDPDGFSGVKIWNGTDFVNYYFVADSIVVPGSVGSVVIADGAVTALKIEAGSIEVDRLSPSVGASLDIQANGSINFLVGQTESNAQAIVDQQDMIDATNSDIAEVGQIASDASSVATDAATAAAGAQATADETAATLQPLAQTYRFTSTGAFIGAPSSPYEFKIENTGAGILYNGEAVSTWDADEMWVKQFRGDIVKLGEHQIETYSGGGTVVREIG